MKQAFRKRLSIYIAMLSVALTAVGPLQAEERVMTLGEILTVARENNADLNALRGEQGVVEAARLKAGLQANPVLDLEGATGALTGSPEESRLSIGVSQEFFTGGKRGKRLSVADSELERFAARLKDLERLTMLEVKLGFYDLHLAQARAENAGKSHALSNQLLLLTRERLAAGDIAEIEVNLAKVEAARDSGSRMEAERDLDSARLRLLTLMGAAPGEQVKIGPSREPGPVAANLAELKVLALKHRPDLQMIVAESARGEAELQLARADRLPNVTAGIGISRESTLTSIGALEEKDTEYLLGLRLSVPIPLFDKNQAGIKEASSRVSSALSRQSSLRRSIELEVEAAYARFTASERALNLYANEILPQLNENVKIMREAYQLGEVGIAAVIAEQRKLHEVNESHLLALHQRNSAFARLEAAVGTDLNVIDGGMK